MSYIKLKIIQTISVVLCHLKQVLQARELRVDVLLVDVLVEVDLVAGRCCRRSYPPRLLLVLLVVGVLLYNVDVDRLTVFLRVFENLSCIVRLGPRRLGSWSCIGRRILPRRDGNFGNIGSWLWLGWGLIVESTVCLRDCLSLIQTSASVVTRTIPWRLLARSCLRRRGARGLSKWGS
jgi:hypothetical protein